MTWSPRSLMKGLPAMLVFALIGFYCGRDLLIPLAVTLVVFWRMHTRVSRDREAVLPAVSILTGHVAWSLSDAASSNIDPFGSLDIVLSGGAAASAFLWPGKGPLLFAGAFQGIALALDLVATVGVPFGSTAHRALAAVVFVRAACVLLSVKSVRFLAIAKGERPPSTA